MSHPVRAALLAFMFTLGGFSLAACSGGGDNNHAQNAYNNAKQGAKNTYNNTKQGAKKAYNSTKQGTQNTYNNAKNSMQDHNDNNQ